LISVERTRSSHFSRGAFHVFVVPKPIFSRFVVPKPTFGGSDVARFLPLLENGLTMVVSNGV
jgi:hypothetical protein